MVGLKATLILNSFFWEGKIMSYFFMMMIYYYSKVVLYGSNLFLHQHNYIAKLFKEFKLDTLIVKLISLPIVDVLAYYHIVGILIFLCNTRPDLSYAGTPLSPYMHLLQQAHLD